MIPNFDFGMGVLGGFALGAIWALLMTGLWWEKKQEAAAHLDWIRAHPKLTSVRVRALAAEFGAAPQDIGPWVVADRMAELIRCDLLSILRIAKASNSLEHDDLLTNPDASPRSAAELEEEKRLLQHVLTVVDGYRQDMADVIAVTEALGRSGQMAWLPIVQRMGKGRFLSFLSQAVRSGNVDPAQADRLESLVYLINTA
jgi:hypothetical protein